MASANKVILIGNLGRDPEVRFAPGGGAVAHLSVATTERYTDREGTARESTEWHRVVLFGKPAEIAQTYLNKGSQVYIEGKLKTKAWQDKTGQRRWTTEVVGERMQMLGKAGASSTTQPSTHGALLSSDDDWDVPFDVDGTQAGNAQELDIPPF